MEELYSLFLVGSRAELEMVNLQDKLLRSHSLLIHYMLSSASTLQTDVLTPSAATFLLHLPPPSADACFGWQVHLG